MADRRWARRIAAAVAATLLVAPLAYAVTLSGGFTVRVDLSTSTSQCLNSAQLVSGSATVQITCAGGEFVSLGLGAPGTVNANLRLRGDTIAPPGQVLTRGSDAFGAAVTSLRVVSAESRNGTLEMYVSF